MKTAKKAALGVLAATVMGLVGPTTMAHADAGDTVSGGCGFNTDQNAVATNGQNQGVIFNLSASQHADNTPSDATVACWIDVNGVEQNGTRITTTDNTVPGVEAGQAQISFAATDTDLVAECQAVTFADGSSWVAPDGNTYGPGVGYCPAATSVTFPPPIVDQALQTVFDTLNSVLALVDLNPVLCPVLKAIGPQNIGGVIIIAADGSLTIQDPLGLIIVTNDCSVA